FLQLANDLLDQRSRPLGPCPHAAVLEVRHEAREPEPLGATLGEVAVPDTLHVALDDDLRCGSWLTHAGSTRIRGPPGDRPTLAAGRENVGRGERITLLQSYNGITVLRALAFRRCRQDWAEVGASPHSAQLSCAGVRVGRAGPVCVVMGRPCCHLSYPMHAAKCNASVLEAWSAESQ